MIRYLTKKGVVFFLIIDVALVAVAVSALRGGFGDGFTYGRMRITSPAFEQDALIPPAHTCDGRDISPPLAWSELPDGTRSLALVVDDQDAPTGIWTHWVVWDIPATAVGAEQDGIPHGSVQGVTSAGTAGWHGPCPPFGMHRYFFKLYALDAFLGLPASATVADLEKAMVGHELDKAGLIGRYERLNR